MQPPPMDNPRTFGSHFPAAQPQHPPGRQACMRPGVCYRHTVRAQYQIAADSVFLVKLNAAISHCNYCEGTADVYSHLRIGFQACAGSAGFPVHKPTLTKGLGFTVSCFTVSCMWKRTKKTGRQTPGAHTHHQSLFSAAQGHSSTQIRTRPPG
eukprot:578132-Amphidinium_carterae.1